MAVNKDLCMDSLIKIKEFLHEAMLYQKQLGQVFREREHENCLRNPCNGFDSQVYKQVVFTSVLKSS